MSVSQLHRKDPQDTQAGRSQYKTWALKTGKGKYKTSTKTKDKSENHEEEIRLGTQEGMI